MTAALANGRFADVITTEAELREIVARPNRWIMGKVRPRLDEDCLRFIARSPFVVLASTAPSGYLDLSPKGDPAGFVQVLDDETLALPDRPGNRRIDSLRNILANPNVGVIFFVPGEGETLRVGGKAIIVRDRNLRESMALNGRVPELATVITVERAYFHCGKCIVRSKLWDGRRDSEQAPPQSNGWLRMFGEKRVSP
jgi:PPOX class probable FMN-dependent enzyme